MPNMRKRPRRGSQNVQHGPGLFVLRSLPDGAMAEIKRHLSRLDWVCLQAACRLPLYKSLDRKERCPVKIGDGERQEQALLSDPQACSLLVAAAVTRAGRRTMHKLQTLSNLKYLRLSHCGPDVPIRCVLSSLKELTLLTCVVDASGCPAIRTLTLLTLSESKVLLSRSGHPFPLVSRDAQSLEVLQLGFCDVVDVAGTGHFFIDAPRLASLELRDVRFHTHATVCSLAGAQGVSPSLLSATFDPSLSYGDQNLRVYTLLADAFQRQILPQLTRFNVLLFTPHYIPSLLPNLRELVVQCPSPNCCGVPPCWVRPYPVGITKLEVSCWHDCLLDQALEGVSNAAKAGMQLHELVLSAQQRSLSETTPCALREASFVGLEGHLKKLTIYADMVDVANMLDCLRGCLRLTHLELKQHHVHSQESSIGVCRLGQSKVSALALPALQKLEIPISPYSLDLRACPRLHTVHVTHAFGFKMWCCESPPIPCIIVSLRALSKLFKMPHKGNWASPKERSSYTNGHWHGQGFESCPVCSPLHTIQLEPSNA